MTIQAHADAILALLDADNTAPALVVYDGRVPDLTEPPYVVVYFADNDTPASSPLTGEYRRYAMWAYCHCAGGNQIAARAVAQRVRAALLDVTPTVTGRKCWPIRREEGQLVDRDESTGLLVMDGVSVYRLESVPA